MSDELDELISELGIECERTSDYFRDHYVEIDSQELLPLLKELRGLRAIVAKLPTTKDGKPVVPGKDVVYMPFPYENFSLGVQAGGIVTSSKMVDEFYSTPEAAKEAQNA